MLEKIIDIAIGAGKIVMQIRQEGFEIQTKKHAFDFVTSADIASEKYILERLKDEFPDDSILAEEKGKIEKNSSRIWMVDPLDGTKDFKKGGDGFSVMIGLCVDGTPFLGVVYVPVKDLVYYAEKNKGAYARIHGEDKKLCVSNIAGIKDSKMVTRIYDEEKRADDGLADFFEVREKIPKSSVGIKLGMIADREADFTIQSKHTSKWDTCAPQIILEEAGGRLTNFEGNPFDYTQSNHSWEIPFVASNCILHESVLKNIQQFEIEKGSLL